MKLHHPTGGQGRLSSPFGWRVLHGRQQFHPGIDIAAPVGTPVLAILDGQVVYQGNRDPKGYGLQIILRHADRLFTQYAHLSAIHVAEGQSVRAGQVIGLVGNTGSSTGPHLHFEVRTDLQTPPTRINPQEVLAGRVDLREMVGGWSWDRLMLMLVLAGLLIKFPDNMKINRGDENHQRCRW